MATKRELEGARARRGKDKKKDEKKVVYYRSKDDAKPVTQKPQVTVSRPQTRRPAQTAGNRSPKAQNTNILGNQNQKPKGPASPGTARSGGKMHAGNRSVTQRPATRNERKAAESAARSVINSTGKPYPQTGKSGLLSPQEKLLADTVLKRSGLTPERNRRARPKTTEELRNSIGNQLHRMGQNYAASQIPVSPYDRGKLGEDLPYVQRAKQRFEEAKAAGDTEGMARAHGEAEGWRRKHGYSGGAAGDEYITARLSQEDYNRLNPRGQERLTDAKLRYDQAATDAERQRIAEEGERIRRNPLYQAALTAATDPNGRRMRGFDMTPEQRAQDAHRAAAGVASVGQNIAGSLGYLGQQIQRVNRDQMDAAQMASWIRDDANYNQALTDLENARAYRERYGHDDPEGISLYAAERAFAAAQQARAQLDRIQNDPRSVYFDPTAAERLGISTDKGETFAEGLLRRAAENRAAATEGLSGFDRFMTDALLSVGQSAPAMALSAIPVVGPELTLGVLGAQAAGQRAYDLGQEGVDAETALLRGLVSGSIEAMTERVPVSNWTRILEGRTGRTALRNLLIQSGEEATEESVSYLANWAADKAARDPNAHLSFAELLENAGMGAVGGAVFGGAGSVIGAARRGGRTAQTALSPLFNPASAETDPVQREIQELFAASRDYQRMADNGLLSQEELDELQNWIQTRISNIQEENAAPRAQDSLPSAPPVFSLPEARAENNPDAYRSLAESYRREQIQTTPAQTAAASAYDAMQRRPSVTQTAQEIAAQDTRTPVEKATSNAQDALRQAAYALQAREAAERQAALNAEKWAAEPSEDEGIKVYRGVNRSESPLDKNLVGMQTANGILGKPEGAPDLIPVEYYTESREDAGHYADQDRTLLEDVLIPQARQEYNRLVMEGRTPDVDRETWARQRAKESYKALTGRDAAQSGHVEEKTITPRKVLDLSKLGEKASVNDIYRAISDMTGISENELDDALVLMDLGVETSDDLVDVFRVLRNEGAGSGVGTRFYNLLASKGYDAVKYAESGTNHYAVLPQQRQEQTPEPVMREEPAEIPATETAKAGTPAAVEREKASLRNAIRMPIKGTNEEALAAGAKSGELSMESVTFGGKVPGFTNEQRASFAEQVIEGAGTDAKEIHVDVPGDGTFTLGNKPENVAKVLNKLKVKANQESIFDKKLDKLFSEAIRTATFELNGETYLTQGHLALPVGEAGAKYAAEKYKSDHTDLKQFQEFVNEIAGNDAVITKQPFIANLSGVGQVYVFQTEQGNFAFNKQLTELIDKGALHYNPDKGKVPCLVSVGEDGRILGFLIGVGGNVNIDPVENRSRYGDLKSIRNAQKAVAEGTGGRYNEGKIAVKEDNQKAVPEPKKATEENKAPHEILAVGLLDLIREGKTITSNSLKTIAENAFGGTRGEGAYDIKTAYDCLELAVNKYLLEADFVRDGNGSARTAETTEGKLQEMLDTLPTQTVRTEEQQQYQQFSTPPNIAYLAAWAANIGKGDVVLEPSAGIGGLAVFGKAWGATVYGNELSSRRAEILRSLGLDEVFTENAEQINNVLPDYVQPSVVLMNPPFSATAGRMSKNSTANAKRHIEQALERLNDGGRLVAILGRGMANDSKTFAGWWDSIRKEYDIRANLSINGENYKKYGTTFDVQLVVIDKTGPQQGKTITGQYDNLADIPAALEGIRNDRTRSEGRAPAVERGGSERGNQPERAGERGGSQPGRPAGNAERAPGSAPGDGELAGVEGGRDGGRTQPERPEQAVPENAEREDGQGRGENPPEAGRGATAEPEPERNAGSESKLPESGLTGEEKPKKAKPRKTNATKASKNDDGVFTEYRPPATPIKGAKKHPAVLVESAAMGAVEAPEATYTPNLPKELITSGALSDAQLSNIVYAGQAHSKMIPDQNKRKGYFIGDGTGVGKGRQISGIILDNFRQGRKKALWISKGQNLYPDAQRDWADIGGNKDDVFNLSKIKADTPVQAKNGIMFTTYDTLASVSKNKKSRLDQIVEWLGDDFDGVIAFDEAHNMGNLLGKKGKMGATKPAQKAIAGDALQRRLPNARVVYVSATMATDVNEMAFADRLGLWGPGTQFNDVKDFVQKISKGGIAAMELVARDMKSMGSYQARSISYNGVEYETLQHDLTPMQKEIYNTLSRAWQVTLKHVNEALNITGASKDGRARAAARSAYYGAMQRFYNQIITSMAVPSVIKDIKEELAAGRSVVLQIVNTNEAETNRQIAAAKESGAPLDDLDITPREALIGYLRNAFPVNVYEEYTDENGNIRSRLVTDSNGKPILDKKAVAIRDNMIAEVEQMSVPEGPLEMIFDAFGTEQVAEVTGRKRRIVPGKDAYGNTVKIEERRSEKSNAADVQAFQDGKKRILIFSDAGGTGKSYHADLRAGNQQQRVHYLLQPGWSAPKAVQGFGRTHRSNEASAPVYKLVTTDVKGQKRFVSTIARRLDQLGALTKGQRQTGSGMFSAKDNLESPLALDSLYNFYKALGTNRLDGLDGAVILEKLGLAEKFQDDYGNFKMNDTLGRDMNTFLNRIMALEYDEQNAVFDAFSRIFDDAYNTALENGTLDMGMETVRADSIEILDDIVIRTDEETGATTNYVQAKLTEKTRILSSVEDLRRSRWDFLGLYKRENGHVYGVFRTADKTLSNGDVVRQFILQTPQQRVISKFVESTFKKEMTRIPEKQWDKMWAEEVKQAPTTQETVRHMLTGTLLPIWNRLPDSGNVKVQRLIADDGRQYLGRIIPPSQIDEVLKSLGAKGRTKQTYTPEQVTAAVFKDGKKAVLTDNRVTLTRRKVGNEWRIEVSGQNLWFLQRQVPDIYMENIGFQNRYFVPNGEKQQATVSAILAANPLDDIVDERESVQYSREKGGISPHPEQWTTDRIQGGSATAPRPLSEIIAQIQHDLDLNITYGHVRGKGIRGQFNPKDKGIRSRLAQDLPTISHEIGHWFDDRFGLTEGKLPAGVGAELKEVLGDQADQCSEKELKGEGLAEFFRAYLTNRETAAIDYPNTTKYVLEKLDAQSLARLFQFADEINAYYSMDADSASSSIRFREEGAPDFRTHAEKIQDMGDSCYQAWVDSNHAIHRLDRETGGDAYIYATNAAYSDAVAGRIITGDLTDMNGQYVGPGLKTALHGINTRNKKEWRDFGEYLVVRHGPERLAAGKRVFADDRKNSTEFMNRRRADLEEKYPAFRDAGTRLIQFERDLARTWGVGTGLISQDTLNAWNEKYKEHVPLNRAIPRERGGIAGTKRGFANQSSPFRRAKGSGLDIIHPAENIMDMVVKLVNAGTRNQVMQKITEEAERFGANATFMEKVPTPVVPHAFDMSGVKAQLGKAGNEALLQGMFTESNAETYDTIIESLDDVMIQWERGKAKGDVVTVLRGGKPEFWKINDKALLESVTSLSAPKLNGLLEAYAVTTRFMTANITGNNPIWSIFSNAPRDLATFFVYAGKQNPFKAIAAIGSAYLNGFNQAYRNGANLDPFFAEYLAMGGGHTSAYSADANLARKARKEISATAGQRIADTINPINWISFISDTIEMGPRFATYKLLRQEGMDPHHAFYHAMDITVNFRKAGYQSRQVNKVVPFFNASVQGIDKFSRFFTAADEKPGNRGKAAAARIGAWVTASAIFATLFYLLNNRDEEKKEDYQQLSNYTKNTFFVIPLGDGKYFAIPKPRELAVVTSLFETGLEYWGTGNDHAFDEFYDYVTDNFLPSVLSDLAKLPTNIAADGMNEGIKETFAGVAGSMGLFGVGFYIGANRDFLGRPIESQSMQNLEPRDRFTDSTSKMAYYIGQGLNMSPQMIDFFGNQVLGYVWKVPRALFPVGDENRDITLGVKNSYIKDNLYSQDLVNWLYDRKDKSERAANSNQDDMDKVIAAKNDDIMTAFYGRFNKLNNGNTATDRKRAARQTVLSMIYEYRKSADVGTVTPVQEAVYDVIRQSGSTELMPAAMQPYIKTDDARYDLTDAQYVEYQTSYNGFYWSLAEEALSGTNPDRKKSALLRQVKATAKEEADKAMLSKLGVNTEETTGKYGTVSAQNVMTFKAGMDLANDDGSLLQEEVITVIEDMVKNGLSKEDASTLFRSKYKSDKNNPWAK